MSIVNDLRELADFLETRPACLEKANHNSISIYLHGGDPETFASLVRELGGKRVKKADDSYFNVVRRLSSRCVVTVFSERSNVCQRKVVGTRTLPATVIPAKPEQVLPEREEEIVVWECPESVLDVSAESPAEAGV